MSGPVERQEWNAGLCSCCEDCGICCYGCRCLCCLFGDNHKKVMGGGCAGPAIIWYLLGGLGCQCLYGAPLRKEIRNRYSLQERPCGDYCVHRCCFCCAICQEARELKVRGTAPQAAHLTTTAAPMPQGVPVRY